MKLRNLIFVLIALFFLIPQFANLWVDYLWFDALGYLSVFIKVLSTKLLLGVAGLVFTTAFIWLNLKYAGRRIDLEELRLKARLRGFELFGVVSILTGIVTAFICSSGWMTVLKFFNAASFGETDAVFAKDLSFYFFKLPFWELLFNYFAGLFLFTGVLTGAFYFLVYQKRREAGEKVEETMQKAKKHVFPLLGVFFLVLAGRIYLTKYTVLFSARGAVFGAAYTDLHVTLPLIIISSVVSFGIGILFLLNFRLQNIKYPAGGVALLVAVLIIGTMAAAVIQSYQVEPNEYNFEKKYIQRNIKNTLKAYDLKDVEVKDFLANYNLTYQDINERNQTVKNIRLWDHRALKDTYSQLQLIRTYYNFHDVDIDRYHLDGNYKQVMLSPRELNQRELPEAAKTWVSKHLVYTHGSGVVMSPVSEISEQGLPIFYLKDIPPQTTERALAEEPLRIENPDIYYGEETNNFVITQTTEEEFDYPKGDENIYSSYEGSGGVRLGGVLNKIAFALHLGDVKVLVSTALKPESRILFRRDINQRVSRVAPFLKYDHDPYSVINDRQIYWIQDAYTVSDRYPYSEPFDGFNYIRNSVKATIDSFNGKVSYYVVKEDPLIKTYRRIFPELFKDFEQMPEKLNQHIRYPEDLFTVQSEIYSTYHMRDPKVFYTKEDKWSIPKELYKGRSQPMEPYYLTLKLPQENETQFVLMLPFTPKGKNNLIAWLGAKSDPPQYGQKVLYQFSKQRLIYGPNQVESRISQDAEISQQITLWSQAGSRVIRGNLLVIPVKDSLLYVEPLFLKASEDAIPELKRVIVAFGDQIAMEPTLQGCLKEIFVGEAKPQKKKPSEEELGLSQPELLDRAKKHYQKARNYLKEGNFSAYAREIEKLGGVLEKLKA